MKWMIASDLHGSAHFCRELLEAYRRERADRLILLGDVLYHGPRNDLPLEYNPKAVIELLNPLSDSILCVRGNCDSEVDQMVLSFPIMADYALLPLEKRLIFITHGHKYHADALPPLHKGDILLHGHTHVPVCRRHGGIVYMNPGSAAIPKEGSSPGYMILENGLFTWKTMEGKAFMVYDENEETQA
ncbi:MAG: phosphodiesterase [Clostridiales bacterium]|nr:phosphodiesterase [Clostridiales bacterium]